MPSGLASLLVATVPIYIAILAWLTGSAPRPRPLVMLGLAGGFVGVGILVGPAITCAAGGRFESCRARDADSPFRFAHVVDRLGSIRAGRENSSSPFLSSAQTMLCGGGLMILAGLVHGEARNFHLREVTAVSLGAFTYLVLIGAVVGYTSYIFLLRHCDPSKVATYAYVNPVVAVLLGAFFAGETLSLRTAVAAAVIVGSVALVITAQQAKEKLLLLSRPQLHKRSGNG